MSNRKLSSLLELGNTMEGTEVAVGDVIIVNRIVNKKDISKPAYRTETGKISYIDKTQINDDRSVKGDKVVAVVKKVMGSYNFIITLINGESVFKLLERIPKMTLKDIEDLYFSPDGHELIGSLEEITGSTSRNVLKNLLNIRRELDSLQDRNKMEDWLYITTYKLNELYVKYNGDVEAGLKTDTEITKSAIEDLKKTLNILTDMGLDTYDIRVKIKGFENELINKNILTILNDSYKEGELAVVRENDGKTYLVIYTDGKLFEYEDQGILVTLSSIDAISKVNLVTV